MPELPEVETVRRQLVGRLRDRTIVDAFTFGTPKFADAPAAVGATFRELDRRGKYLIARLEPSAADRVGAASLDLVLHLGMTGRLGIEAGGIDDGVPHLRAAWQMDDGNTLQFVDARRFGRVRVVATGAYATIPTLANLGPEPFDPAFTAASLRRSINATSRPLKTALLSQRPVAGVGNIYADEALWRAGLRPDRRRNVSLAAAARLRNHIIDVLNEGITHGGSTVDSYRDALGGEGGHQRFLDAYGRAGLACNRCGRTMRRIELDGRSTTFCPGCQR